MTTEEILDAIANMKVMEVADLVKAMEEKFGVSAAAPVAVAAGGAAAAGAGEEASDEVDVILASVDASKKIAVIKEVRALTSLGLKEAKDLVEAGGKAVKEGVTAAEAKEIKEKLEAAGAKVEIK